MLAGAIPWSPALVLAAALPIVFLHLRFQPTFTVGSRTAVTVALSDLAILAVGLVALAEMARTRLRPLRPGLPIWLAAAAFLLFGIARSGSATHLVSALKFAEYAILALALPLLIRSLAELRLLLWTVGLWSGVASFVGVLQFFGVNVAGGWGAGRRQPSFLDQLDLSALSGMALTIGLVGLALGTARVGGRRLVALATVAGALGLILSASLAALAGVGVAAALIAAIALYHRGLRLRPAAVGAVALALVVGGTVALRGGDLVQFTRFLGINPKVASSTTDVQTYTQRTVLVYIGWKIFLDHKAIGAGWNASEDPATFERYLPAAHRRFPDAAPLSFPSRQHTWGVQNAYVQALADLGVVGFALLLALLAAGGWVALRSALRRPAPALPVALLAVGWTLVAMGVWSALGLLAGAPADATLWLGLGLAAAAPGLGGRHAR